MRREGLVLVFTSRIAFNTRKFTVHVNEHAGLLFLNRKKRQRKVLFFFFSLDPGLDLRREMGT